MKKLLVILSLLFCTTAYAQEGLKQVEIRDFSGGMSSNILADLLQPNQSASMVNISLSRHGKLEKRKGQALFVEDVTDMASTVTFTGIGRFDPDANTSYLVAASGYDIIRAQSGDSTWTQASGTDVMTTGKTTEFVQANDLLFILNGFDPTSWYDGSTFTKASTYPASPPTASTGAWLRNYLFLAGATAENDWIYFSNNLEPKVFDASDIIKINTGDGQKIQHLEPFRLNELIIYKERSIFVLDIAGAVLSGWTVQPISVVVGTTAPRSVVSLGNDQWFLSSNPVAIRSLARTQFDKILVNEVSSPIQDIFDGTGAIALNKTQMGRSAAILFDDKYLLAIPTGTSTVNNTVVVHDFRNQSWYLITGWYPRDWVLFDERLFYIDENDGRVVECFTGTDGDLPPGPDEWLKASTSSQAIDYEYISRFLDFDSQINFKQPDAVSVEFDPTGNYEAIVSVNMDQNGWASIGSVNLAGNSLTLDFTLPDYLGRSGITRKTFQIQDKGEFKEMQVKVSNTASQQSVILQRINVFARPRPWRRE